MHRRYTYTEGSRIFCLNISFVEIVSLKDITKNNQVI